MSQQYLILIEQLVHEGRSEREIDRIVRQVVDQDAEVLDDVDGPGELEQLRAA
jgi:hypothetical protein